MTRSMTYCVLPADTSPSVVDALRLRYESDPWMSVILDDRANEAPPTAEVLRQRRPVLRWGSAGNEVPGAHFEERMPPVDLSLVDLSDAEIIKRAIEHDTAASSELRWRAYARILVMLSDRLGNRTKAHELVPGVMDAMQEALPTFPPHADFSRWLGIFVAEMPLEL